MLAFNNVTQKFGHYYIFQDLSLALDAPRVRLSGANGSGKTTLLLLAAGLLKPHQGNITFNGQEVFISGAKHNIGISASKIALPGFMTVKALLNFHARQFHCSNSEEMAVQFALIKFMTSKISDLSLGNYKKLSLITALMHQPQLLLLDEPTNGLDNQAREVLETILSQYQGQVVVASHDSSIFGDDTAQHIQMQNIGVA